MTAGGDPAWYVYALAEPGLPHTLELHGRALCILPINGVDAVVERNEPAREPTPDVLRAQHAVVTALAAKVPALLPARFGSAVTEAGLRALIATRAADIHAALDLVRGCVQLTVRVFGEPLEPAAGQDATAVATDQVPTGTAYLQRRRARAHAVPPEVDVIRRTIGELVRSERVETGERGLRVTVFHLVARDMVATYQERAAGLQSLLAPHVVRVSGPWPAFAFAPELF